jgi:hypothetical protein
MSDDIGRILGVSRRNNTLDDITGELLFSDGCFAQVLEGPLEMVENTFERIQCDARHVNVTVLQAGPISSRDFPYRAMGFTGSIASDHWCGDLALARAFSGQSSNGSDLLDRLRCVAIRESEWLATA